jgi:F-type H+-transporting ATPase subunit O
MGAHRGEVEMTVTSAQVCSLEILSGIATRDQTRGKQEQSTDEY